MARECIIRACYEIVSEESAKNGDFEDRGIAGEERFDTADYETHEEFLGGVVTYLKRNANYFSSSEFYVRGWYIGAEKQDMSTGDYTTYSYHLEGFTDQEKEEVYKKFIE